MPRTVEQIEDDIAAVKANHNWSSDPVAMRLCSALVEEKNLLTQIPVPPPAGKY